MTVLNIFANLNGGRDHPMASMAFGPMPEEV